MTETEEDAILDEIQVRVKERYKGATADDLDVLAMMLQDFDAEAAKRIPGWTGVAVVETPAKVPN